MSRRANFAFYLLPSLVRGTVAVLVTVPVTTYFLDPADFGLAAALSILSNFLPPLSTPNTTMVLSGHYFELPPEERRTLVFNVFLVVALLKAAAALLFLAGGWVLLPRVLASYNPRYYPYYCLCVLAAATAGLWPLVSDVLTLARDARRHAALDLGQYLVAASVMVVGLTVLRLRTSVLFLGPAAAGVFVAAAGTLVLLPHMRARVERRWITTTLRLSLPMVPLQLSEMANQSGASWFIQSALDLRALGIYAHSLGYGAMMNLGAKAFNRTVFPDLVECYAGQRPTDELRSLMRFWYLLLSLGGAYLIMFSAGLIGLLTHGKFTSAAPLVGAWYGLVLIQAFGFPYIQYLITTKRAGALSALGITANLATIALNGALVLSFGLWGVAAGGFLSLLVLHGSYRVYATRSGCPVVADGTAVVLLLALGGLFVLTHVAHAPFAARLVLAAVATLALGARCAGELRRLRRGSAVASPAS